MKVRITAYKDYLVIDTEPPFEIDTETFIPAGDGRLGSVLLNTKTNLGVSDEALVLLRRVPKSPDAIGGIMWWPVGDTFAFGWMGGFKVIISPTNLTGDRDFAVREGGYIPIPNDVPEGAKAHLDTPYP